MSETSQFNNCWLGYDVSFEKVESHPDVLRVRGEGIDKRVESAEHHVTVGWFANANLNQIGSVVKEAEQILRSRLYQTKFVFDGMGSSDGEKGKYVYFTPSQESAGEAFFLKDFFSNKPVYDKTKNCRDLHLSIGGPDPFSREKPKQEDLSEPLRLTGKLVFVGNDGKQFRRFEWHSMKKQFVEIGLAKSLKQEKKSEQRRDPSVRQKTSVGMTEGREVPPPVRTVVRDDKELDIPKVTSPMAINQIAIFPKVQADTAVAVYLLKGFGSKKFPGIERAPIVFWTQAPSEKTPAQHEAEGTLLVDLGGMFDHHLENERRGKRETCVSDLVAAHLEITNHPSLKKLLKWARRDDLEGKGTISTDNLDRAFGLSGIIMNLNREYHEQPVKILEILFPIIDAHVREEHRRNVLMPKEWEQLLEIGKAQLVELQQGKADIAMAVIESDNTSLPGFARAAKKMDLILQRRSSGHTNILTNQIRSIDLRGVIEGIRLAEAKEQGITLSLSRDQLQAFGAIDEVSQWYYDSAGNSIQNGGINPQGIAPTRLSVDQIAAIIRETLPHGVIGHLKRERNAGR